MDQLGHERGAGTLPQEFVLLGVAAAARNLETGRGRVSYRDTGGGGGGRGSRSMAGILRLKGGGAGAENWGF